MFLVLIFMIQFLLRFNAATNITRNSSDCASSSTSELEQDDFMHKRRKTSNNMLETLSSIMREPVKINISSQAEKTIRVPEPVQCCIVFFLRIWNY